MKKANILTFEECLELNGIQEKEKDKKTKSKFLYEKGAILTLLLGTEEQKEKCLNSYGYKE